MKTFFLMFLLILTGCFSKTTQTDEQIQKLNASIEANKKALRVIDCHAGILFAIQSFQVQLKGKVTKEQFDMPWNKCKEFVK